MNNDNRSLSQLLHDYSQSNACAMHMPGHKRQRFAGSCLPLELDITEINGFDNLHQPEGILQQAMQNAAALYGAAQSYFLVNGSSGGILAGICAACKPQSTIIMARGCHKSVYHAVELRQLNPVYLGAELDDSFGVAQSITPAQVEQAITAHPDAALVLITSPTYEGVISDIASIAQLCHAHGIPLMVDEAHGAHLGFSPCFSGGAVAAGADIVIQSLHKTLPSPTQTAIAHRNGSLINATEFARQLAVFQTSSPSYLFMAAIDDCLRFVQQNQAQLFSAYEQRLKCFSQAMTQLKHLRVLCHGKDDMHNHAGFFGFDKGKLVISTRSANLTGTALKDRLREEFSIELEMAMGDYALAMTSICDTDEMMDRLANALLSIDAALSPAQTPLPIRLPLPPLRLAPWKARMADSILLPLEQAENKICAESIWAYPPGIPLITAGECITPEFLCHIRLLAAQGVELYAETADFPHKISAMQE